MNWENDADWGTVYCGVAMNLKGLTSGKLSGLWAGTVLTWDRDRGVEKWL